MENIRNVFEVLPMYVWGLLTMAVVSALFLYSWIKTR
jgi:hypothetical protein